jgi:DNA-binding CsgD family transcriptional regulator
MGALRDQLLQQNVVPSLERRTDVGLVLMDLSYQTIGYDRGAAAILNGGLQPATGFSLPRELQQAIQAANPAELPAVRMHFRRGTNEYKCHAYLVRSQNSAFPQKILALHLERDCTGEDAVAKLTVQYHLTAREQEALSGIAMGLSTKDLADRMRISPNTVKSFLRLIMIKVGVTTRGEIVAKLLEYSDNGTT